MWLIWQQQIWLATQCCCFECPENQSSIGRRSGQAQGIDVVRSLCRHKNEVFHTTAGLTKEPPHFVQAHDKVVLFRIAYCAVSYMMLTLGNMMMCLREREVLLFPQGVWCYAMQVTMTMKNQITKAYQRTATGTPFMTASDWLCERVLFLSPTCKPIFFPAEEGEYSGIWKSTPWGTDILGCTVGGAGVSKRHK